MQSINIIKLCGYIRGLTTARPHKPSAQCKSRHHVIIYISAQADMNRISNLTCLYQQIPQHLLLFMSSVPCQVVAYGWLQKEIWGTVASNGTFQDRGRGQAACGDGNALQQHHAGTHSPEGLLLSIPKHPLQLLVIRERQTRVWDKSLWVYSWQIKPSLNVIDHLNRGGLSVHHSHMQVLVVGRDSVTHTPLPLSWGRTVQPYLPPQLLASSRNARSAAAEPSLPVPPSCCIECPDILAINWRKADIRKNYQVNSAVLLRCGFATLPALDQQKSMGRRITVFI